MTDYLFKGMTRPPEIGGVTQGAIIVIAVCSVFIIGLPMIFFRSMFGIPAGIFFGILAFSVCRIICESDINTFKYVAANLRFLTSSPGRRLGKSMRTYCAAPLRKR